MDRNTYSKPGEFITFGFGIFFYTMLRVGLTGGIGSGKTTVARIFEVIGIPVYYADLEARRLMNEDPTLRSAIIDAFGEKAYDADGKLDRPYIAALVFNQPDKLSLLNSLTHPATIRDAESWMRDQRTPYAIKEAALIFESGSDQYLDFVIGVQSPLALRINRIMERDRITEDEVLIRMRRQMNEEEKMKKCDAVVVNDEVSFLIPQVLKIHQLLLKRSK